MLSQSHRLGRTRALTASSAAEGRAERLEFGTSVFLGTYEKQLDGKRRLLIPQEFRTADNGAEHGVFCFLAIGADCLEAGGDKLMAEYVARIEALPFGSAERDALEESFYAAQRPLAYDGGGRITLPESLCEDAGLGDDVVITGMGARFRIWDRARWNERRAGSRALASRVMNGQVPLQGEGA